MGLRGTFKTGEDPAKNTFFNIAVIQDKTQLEKSPRGGNVKKRSYS
jgi:hypothetical protein